LKTPKKLHKILKVLVQESHRPVTAKIRLGWDNALRATDVAKSAQDAGINALFVHGRTRIQGYSGEIDYRSIRKIKKSLQIPVIASGNILNARLAKKMIDETGCNGIIVARGALGNPWIFQEISDYFKKGIFLPQPSSGEIADVMKEHLSLLINYRGEKRGIIQFRKFYTWYTRGFSGVKTLRSKTVKVKTKGQMLGLIKEFCAQTRQNKRKKHDCNK
jgi:nifR3 family TIM-barrel protein